MKFGTFCPYLVCPLLAYSTALMLHPPLISVVDVSLFLLNALCIKVLLPHKLVSLSVQVGYPILHTHSMAVIHKTMPSIISINTGLLKCITLT